ncbi:ABC-2 type transport system permease protein [Paenibacillus endophyticus]|uniref:ABC-2 type transport system permease protein n=1 Tax=Paenibacillus endophyticus TaxID=1294268 RepID=A0A7W5C450_9BACL|nr:ABC transporter permease [Paenibacillus endophyticus]MBB3150888.1 ABC-2 type transport system permease protein [Paenibacillus endophyticus]
MGNFLPLIQNENMKIYRRPRTWVMVGILVLLVLTISILWLIFGERSNTSMWDVAFMESSILFLLVTIFTVVIAAGGVAEEFTSGTIKLLLIRPWSRSKILLSKYISIMIFALLLAIILFGSTLLVNWICFGINAGPDAETTFVGMDGGNPFSYMLKYYGLTLVSLVVTVTLAFMLSTIFRSSGLAIGFALFLLLGVNSFVGLIAMLDYTWIDYLLFIHLNLTQYLDGNPMREGMTLGYSLTVLGVYYVVFIALTWYIFNKRDVAS